MRIFIDLRNPDIASGIETYSSQLLIALSKLESDIKYYVQMSRTFSALNSNKPNIKINSQYRLPVLWTQLYLPLSTLFSGKEFDLYFFPDQKFSFFWLKGKTIVTIHDVTFLKVKTRSYMETRRLAYMTHHIMKRANGIIFVSEKTREQAIALFGPPRGINRVIYEGYESAIFNSHYALDNLNKVISKHKLPPEYLLYVGHYRPHKNLIGLLEAFKILISEPSFRHLKLILVGSKQHSFSKLNKEIARAQAKGYLIQLGIVARKELSALMKGSIALVMPSFCEGFGLPVIEAMACGVPVACSKAGSLPEIAGDGALYFDPHDPEDMAEIISEVISDSNLRKQLKFEGLERASQFSWDKAAVQTLALFREVCNQT